MSPVREALEAIRSRIARACARADRDPDTVRLVAVTKTVPVERVRELVECGHTLLGENRVQEAQAKMPHFDSRVCWHLIGHLQRNKARHAVGRFELLHGVDGEKLAHEIDRRAAEAGIRQAVLVQVNLSDEATKHGIAGDDAPRLLGALGTMEHLELRGLMTIPPPAADAEQSRDWFRQLRALRDETAERLGRPLPELSMGMTDDFEVAVEEGATLVRVGRAIFGDRPPPSTAASHGR